MRAESKHRTLRLYIKCGGWIWPLAFAGILGGLACLGGPNPIAFTPSIFLILFFGSFLEWKFQYR